MALKPMTEEEKKELDQYFEWKEQIRIKEERLRKKQHSIDPILAKLKKLVREHNNRR